VQAPTVTIPTDDQFFSKTKKGKPNVAFLKDHFYHEGRIEEEHALYIIEQATRLLRVEPNVLTVDTPVTGAAIDCRFCLILTKFCTAVCGDIFGEYVRIPSQLRFTTC
jgi:hypothetical protein